MADQDMIEKLKVRAVVERYCDGLSRRDWDAVESVYAEDAAWEELPPVALKFVGRTDIVAGTRFAIEQMKVLVMTIHSCIAEIDGDRATARSMIHEFGYLNDTDKIEMYGYYEDQLVKRNSQWQFIDRVFHPQWWQLPDNLLTHLKREAA